MSPRQPAPHGRSKTAGYAVIWLSLGARGTLVHGP